MKQEFNITNQTLDTMSFNETINVLYLSPEELLQSIYNELTDAGIPSSIALPATKKAFNLTRDAVTDTILKIIANQVDVSGWGGLE
ncbi:hypothetical protein N4Q63_15590 [Leclercia adecarboxylata]|uniref:Uncharacterized protein n=1 Tax=Leclercia adecarboxylata TaxID=83655 RepID=A0A9X3YB02_9ENTR|nr:hypothetical protein [Leclercia adecarboxylata]MBD1404584.1 hypothetical protein [Leclercia adecarboxylata]MDC6623250.1 hypothetical protein [Leclercia adecarboxylata]MDC6634338.1 hypothetical protein [Leclercia adecarboxylata]MDC6639452.1 hypothetical protein [Leclercia adecarboxylata]MDC6650320.1 hypothetical protein [Leclercia adecarboxylata]